MKKTESYFGLETHNLEPKTRVTADGGESYLPRYRDMRVEEFNALVTDIETWREERMTASDISDLKEILDV